MGRSRTRERRWPSAYAVLAVMVAGLQLVLVSAESAGAVIAYAVSLTVSPPALDLAKTNTATATAVVNFNNSAQNGVSVRFTSSGDAVFSPASCTTGSNGSCSVRVKHGTTDGSQTITAIASTALGSGSATASLVEFTPPLSVAVTFRNGVNRISPNGLAQTAAVVTVLDQSKVGIPGQVLNVTTSAASNPVSIGPVQDVGGGSYIATLTAPLVLLSSAPTWTGDGLLAQTITATDSAYSASGSQSLSVAYPALHTVQAPSPGLYDDFNRPVHLAGLDAVEVDVNNTDAMYTSRAGGDVYHLAGAQYMPFDTVYRDPSPYSWNATIARVQLSDLLWCATDAACDTPTQANGLVGTCGDKYRNYVQTIVDRLTEVGIMALIDLHRVGAISQPPAAPVTCGSGQVDQTQADLQPDIREMADYAYAPTFWKEVATQYANNPLVAFDLYNEPELHNQDSACPSSYQGAQTVTPPESPDKVWLDAGLSGTGDAADTVIDPQGDTIVVPASGLPGYRVAGMQLLYNSVRGAAAKNLVFVSGIGPQIGSSDQCNENAAYDLSPVLNGFAISGGTNVVYASHPYYGCDCASNNSGSGGAVLGVTTSGFPPNLQTAVYDVAQQYPVAFTEFGTAYTVTPADGQNFNQGLIHDAQANNLVGWINFEWLASYLDSQKYGLIKCINTSPTGDCNGDVFSNLQPYQFYQPDQFGQPAYAAATTTPALN